MKSWCRTFSSKEEFEKELAESIHQCEDDDPPTRLTRSVKKLCVFKYKLDVTYSSLKDHTGVTGKRTKKLDYDLEMIPSGASNEFRVLYKGEKLGSHNLSTEFQ